MEVMHVWILWLGLSDGKFFFLSSTFKNNFYIYKKSLKFTFDESRVGGRGGGGRGEGGDRNVRVILREEGKEDYEETTERWVGQKIKKKSRSCMIYPWGGGGGCRVKKE
jgi:hypothetical protein